MHERKAVTLMEELELIATPLVMPKETAQIY